MLCGRLCTLENRAFYIKNAEMLLDRLFPFPLHLREILTIFTTGKTPQESLYGYAFVAESSNIRL